jgi:small conductance mechanosensitive channel
MALGMSLGSSSPALAEKKPDIKGGEPLLVELPAKKVGEQAAELLARINQAVERNAHYKQKLPDASAEDQLVLRLQMSSLLVQAFEDFHELAGVLGELEKEAPQPELRTQMEELFRRTTPVLWEHIDRVNAEIDTARARRVSAPVEDRQNIEDRVTRLTERLNNLYEISHQHIQGKDQFGLDATEGKSVFIGLLKARADALSGRIQLDLNRIDDLDAQLEATPEQAETPVLLIAAKMSLDNNTASMTATLDLMDTYTLSTEHYRAQLLAATRDISTITVDKAMAATLLDQAVDNVMGWVTESGAPFLIKLMIFIVILVIFFLLARLVRKVVDFGLRRSKVYMSRLLRRMIVSASSTVVMVVGLLLALSQLDFDLGPLLAGLGIAGLVVGLALQDTLANFASGMMILFYHPYDVGDMLEVNGTLGKVNRMNLVSTTVLTLDNQTLVIPNKKMWGDVIKNVTAQDMRRIDMVFGISYSADIPKAERVLSDILVQHKKILEDPEPIVRVHNLGDSSVDFAVRPWVAIDDYLDVYWDVTRAVKMRFDEEGISIPFPQRDVHIYEERLAKPAAE